MNNLQLSSLTLLSSGIRQEYLFSSFHNIVLSTLASTTKGGKKEMKAIKFRGEKRSKTFYLWMTFVVKTKICPHHIIDHATNHQTT